MVGPLLFHGESMLRPPCALGAPTVCPWCFRGGSVAPSWSMEPMLWVRGASVVCQWRLDNVSMAFPCLVRGSPLVHGGSVEGPRFFRGAYVVSCFRGVPVVL